VLLGSSLETYWEIGEHLGNLMGTKTKPKKSPRTKIQNYSSPFSTYSVYMAGFLTKNW